MNIKSITIHAFGKFHNKTMVFKPGLNVIYGENEIGKSTMHAFIEAMFYGFYKPYTKRKVYEQSYDKFLPWDHNGYSGHLIYEDAGQELRLERQFIKGKETLDIYEVSTGKNITDSYDYNKVTRLYDISKKHFGFNKVAYRNTISLAQMKSRTDEDLIREIKDNMSNMASAHDANISVEKVLKEIDIKKDEIGSKRKKTSPYFKSIEKRKSLEEALKSAQTVEAKIRDEEKKKEALIQQQKRIQLELDELNKRTQGLQSLGYQKLYDKVIFQQEEIEKMTEVLKKLSLYKDFNIQVANRVQKEREVIKDLEQECVHLKSKLQTLFELIAEDEKRIRQLDFEDHYDEKYHQIRLALENWQKVERDALIIRNDLKVLEGRKIDEPTANRRATLISCIGAIVFGGLAILMGILVSPILYALGFISLLLILYAFVTLHKDNLRVSSEYEQLQNWKNSRERLKSQIEEQEKVLRDILIEQQAESFEALRDLKDQILKKLSQEQLKREQVESLTKKMEMLKEEQKSVESDLALKNKQIEEYRFNLQELLKTYHIEDENSAQLALEKHLEFERIDKEIEAKKELIIELLGDQTLEELKDKIGDNMLADTMISEDEQQLAIKRDQLNRELSEIREAISKALTMSQEWSKRTRPVVEIEEDIDQVNDQINDFDRAIEVLDIVKNGISQIAENTQNNFAPQLNQALSEAVDQISEHKYSDIKVNPQMELTVFDKTLNRTVKADSLSDGTIDMMYFGLRMGISQILSEGKQLPLILDDAFVQYDDHRIKNVLDLLANQHRQVILFTCHRREIQILEKHNSEFNIIHL